MDKHPGSKVLTTSTTRMTVNVTGKNKGESYPKGSGSKAPNPSSFNPMNTPGSNYALKGV